MMAVASEVDFTTRPVLKTTGEEEGESVDVESMSTRFDGLKLSSSTNVEDLETVLGKLTITSVKSRSDNVENVVEKIVDNVENDVDEKRLAPTCHKAKSSPDLYETNVDIVDKVENFVDVKLLSSPNVSDLNENIVDKKSASRAVDPVTSTSDVDENDIPEDGLIARGPCPNKFDRTRTVTHPYIRPCSSPYSDTSSPLSSQGSPPIILEERRCSSGGAMTLGYNMTTFLNDSILENAQPISPPNRHQYMHKAGGEIMQILNSDTSTKLNVTPPSNYLTLAPSPSFSLSPAPSPYQSSVNSVSTSESDFLDNFCEGDTSPSSLTEEIPEEFLDFVTSCPTSNNGIDQVLYNKKIDEILLNLDNKQNGGLKIINGSPMLPITVIEEGKVIRRKTQQLQHQPTITRLNTSVNGTNHVAPSMFINNGAPVTVVLVTPEPNRSRQQLRPIKPKVDITPRVYPVVNKINPVTSNANALRDAILGKYAHDDRRKFHCMVTKCTDHELRNVDKDGDTQLHIAIANELDVPSVFLIDRFSNSDILDLNAVNHSMATPLLCAVRQQLPHIVEYLLAKGADPNKSCRQNGGTALHYAVKRGKEFMKVIEVLGKHPSTKIDSLDCEHKTPLHWAIDNHNSGMSVDNQRVVIDSLPCIRYLIRKGASVFCHENLGGKTAIHMAVEKKSLEILQLFCEVNNVGLQKAVNKQNSSGHAPLHFVATMNNISEGEQVRFAQVLIKMGACVQITNREHKCPVDLVDKDRKEVRQILLPHRQRNK